jgi:CxxC motif-containing protein (DUF1111 family)
MMPKNIGIGLIIFSTMATLILSCQKLIPEAPEEDALLDGTIENLTYAQNRQFLAGDIAVNDLIFTADAGLGSVFVATSCGGCHAGDGKGHPSTTLTRFGQTDVTGNKFLGRGGPQLQHRAVPGFVPEQLPAGEPFSKFTAPITTGLGFLALVSDADLLAMADADDLNGDGISGVPNWNEIPDYVTPKPDAAVQNGKYICRFGKKASVYDLLQQTAAAFSQDIGIASVFEPIDVYSNLEIDPEVPTQTINDVVFYLTALKAPIQRTASDHEILKGVSLFKQIGCESCHRQTLKTGFSPIIALSEKEIHPYTDLLLHDMGSSLDDGYTEGSAKTYEWRTPPLWGLGLAPNSQGGGYFLLHDGRAKSIEEAILLHGGEGGASMTKFAQLNNSDKQAIIKFLESL